MPFWKKRGFAILLTSLFLNAAGMARAAETAPAAQNPAPKTGTAPAPAAKTPAPKTAPAPAPAAKTAPAPTRHSFLHKLVMYIPDRIFDTLDVVRARVRIGPGFALGLRASDVLDFYAGAYTSIWVGLPGPRFKPSVPIPLGVESLAGIEVGMADGTSKEAGAPQYGPLEIGASVQVVLAGVDAGVDLHELIDLIAGFLFVDISGDDL